MVSRSAKTLTPERSATYYQMLPSCPERTKRSHTSSNLRVHLERWQQNCSAIGRLHILVYTTDIRVFSLSKCKPSRSSCYRLSVTGKKSDFCVTETKKIMDLQSIDLYQDNLSLQSIVLVCLSGQNHDQRNDDNNQTWVSSAGGKEPSWLNRCKCNLIEYSPIRKPRFL